MDSLSTESSDLILQSVTDPSNQQLLTINSSSHQLSGQCLAEGKVITVDATIVREPQGARIECKTGGLAVNNEPTQSAWLNQGDLIQVGYSTYHVIETGCANPADSQTRLQQQLEVVESGLQAMDNDLAGLSTEQEPQPQETVQTPATESGFEQTEESSNQTWPDSDTPSLESGQAVGSDFSPSQSTPLNEPGFELNQPSAPGLSSNPSFDAPAGESLGEASGESLEEASGQAFGESFGQVSGTQDSELGVEPANTDFLTNKAAFTPESDVPQGLGNSDLTQDDPAQTTENGFEFSPSETPTFEQSDPQAVKVGEESEPEETIAEADANGGLESPEKSLEKLLAALKSVDTEPTSPTISENDVVNEDGSSDVSQGSGFNEPPNVPALNSSGETPEKSFSARNKSTTFDSQTRQASTDDSPQKPMSLGTTETETTSVSAGDFDNDTATGLISADRDDDAFGNVDTGGGFASTTENEELSTQPEVESSATTADISNTAIDEDADDAVAMATARYFKQIQSTTTQSDTPRADLQAPDYLTQTSPSTTADEAVASLKSALLNPSSADFGQSFAASSADESSSLTDQSAETLTPSVDSTSVASTSVASTSIEKPNLDGNDESTRVEQAVASWREALAKDGETETSTPASPVNTFEKVDEPITSGDVDSSVDDQLSGALSRLQSQISAGPSESANQGAATALATENEQADFGLSTGTSQPALETAAVETANVETDRQPPAEPVDNSVAAVLERMNLTPDCEDSFAQDSPASETSEPIDQETKSLQAEPEPKLAPESVAEPVAAPAEEESDDVQSYMNSLLQRLNGGSSKPDAEAAASPTAATNDSEQTASPIEETVPQPEVEPLRADEFVPKRVAPEVNSNMAAMRELANAATKSALVTSMNKKTQSTRTWQLTSAVCGLLGSIFFGLLSHSFGDIFSIAAMVCVVTSLGTGGLFVHTKLKANAVGK